MLIGKNTLLSNHFVYAAITNADRTFIPEDIRPVTFTIEGDAKMVGDNPHKAEAGISSILLMAGKTSEIVMIKECTDGLTVGELVVNVHSFLL